jgi:hypothetical protein
LKFTVPLADLPTEFLQDQRLEIGLVIDNEDGRGHAACPSLVSISWHSTAKSIGLVNRPSAPRSIAFRRLRSLEGNRSKVPGTILG